eukprot:924695-Rhodomonas_salina.2
MAMLTEEGCSRGVVYSTLSRVPLPSGCVLRPSRQWAIPSSSSKRVRCLAGRSRLLGFLGMEILASSKSPAVERKIKRKMKEKRREPQITASRSALLDTCKRP